MNVEVKIVMIINMDKYGNIRCVKIDTKYMSLLLLSDFNEFEDECFYFGGNNDLRIINIIYLNNK